LDDCYFFSKEKDLCLMIYSREKRLNESSFDKTELQYDPGPGVMAESNPLLLESPILF